MHSDCRDGARTIDILKPPLFGKARICLFQVVSWCPSWTDYNHATEAALPRLKCYTWLIERSLQDLCWCPVDWAVRLDRFITHDLRCMTALTGYSYVTEWYSRTSCDETAYVCPCVLTPVLCTLRCLLSAFIFPQKWRDGLWFTNGLTEVHKSYELSGGHMIRAVRE